MCTVKVFIESAKSRSMAMKASVLDLRRNMKKVVDPLDRNESVTFTYRGKDKADIVPHSKK